MAQKNNIRSIRFSDELAELINQQVGRTFTEKFENLVTRCVWELPKQEQRLKAIREEIAQEQKRLSDLQRATEELHRLEKNLKSAEFYFGIVERGAKKIADQFIESETQNESLPPQETR